MKERDFEIEMCDALLFSVQCFVLFKMLGTTSNVVSIFVLHISLLVVSSKIGLNSSDSQSHKETQSKTEKKIPALVS